MPKLTQPVATWHYGLMARWWAERQHRQETESDEVAFFRRAVDTHELPYNQDSVWPEWLPTSGKRYPHPWPASGDHLGLSSGEELELLVRLAHFDPLLQRRTLDLRARLWRAGTLVVEEEHQLQENLYFVQELLLLLEACGFSDIGVEGRYTLRPATPADGTVVMVAAPRQPVTRRTFAGNHAMTLLPDHRGWRTEERPSQSAVRAAPILSQARSRSTALAGRARLAQPRQSRPPPDAADASETSPGRSAEGSREGCFPAARAPATAAITSSQGIELTQVRLLPVRVP